VTPVMSFVNIICDWICFAASPLVLFPYKEGSVSTLNYPGLAGRQFVFSLQHCALVISHDAIPQEAKLAMGIPEDEDPELWRCVDISTPTSCDRQ
jgi:hypothetical protein